MCGGKKKTVSVNRSLWNIRIVQNGATLCGPWKRRISTQRFPSVCFCMAIVSAEKRFDNARGSRLPPIVSPQLKLLFVATTASHVCVLISDPEGSLQTLCWWCLAIRWRAPQIAPAGRWRGTVQVWKCLHQKTKTCVSSGGSRCSHLKLTTQGRWWHNTLYLGPTSNSHTSEPWGGS